MILLWGLPDEAPMAMVRDALRRLGARVAFLDQRSVLDTEVELSVSSKIEGTVRSGDQTIDLGSVSAVYLRPYASCRLPIVASAGEGSPAWQHSLAVDHALWNWSELTPALVVNRLSAQAANSSKPYQLKQIRSFGFAVPDTLVTTDPEAAREFWAEHGTVIYKSISGIRSVVSSLGTEHTELLSNVSWCPTQFQRYIPGTDYRVHIVKREVFACEIVSEATDYRYAARQQAVVKIRPCQVPRECADRCTTLVAAMGLVVAGIDLRRTPEGAWYCFEVNPSPGFAYYQQACGQPLDRSIARLLAIGPGE